MQSTSRLLSKVTLYDVSPRDGLQNAFHRLTRKPVVLPPSVRYDFACRLANAGLENVEVASFVSEKWVPCMGGADVVTKLCGEGRIDGSLPSSTKISVLTPNTRGFEGAVTCVDSSGKRIVDEVAVFGSVSEGFSQKNINCSVEESVNRFTGVVEEARKEKVDVRGYISCVMGCPYDGDVNPVDVARLVEKYLSIGCTSISLGDTIGCGTPEKTRAMLGEVMAAVGGRDAMKDQGIAAHFHDTNGQALTNIKIAIEEFDVRVVDGTVGGLGGCPYAGEGASGNVSLEGVCGVVDEIGGEHGVDLEKLGEVREWIDVVLREVDGRGE